MKKILLTIASIALCGNLIFAQITDGESGLRKESTDTVEGWKKGGIVSTNLAQTNLTNWAAGGENSLAINGIISIYANYKKGKNVWNNSLDLGYGILGTGKDSLEYKKTDDKIDFTSKYGYKASKNIYYALLLNFKTQMANGYDYSSNSPLPISTYLAPAYLTFAAGFDYMPNSYVSVFIAPATSRTTIVTLERLANAGAFGVDSSKNIRNEFGGYIRFLYKRDDFKHELLKNVAFTSKLDLFSNYAVNPENIDINWEMQIAMKVNKYITVNFNTHLIYDDDITFGKDTNGDGAHDKFSPKTQFKEILGVGLSYKF